MARTDTLTYHLRRFRHVRPVYLGTAFVTSGAVSVFLLRRNNLKMADLRDALREADKNNTDIQGAFQNLQQYVLHHMNTSLATESVYPPIQLVNTYNRLVEAEKAKVDAANKSLYTDAQSYCQSLNSVDFSGRNRVPCIEQYVQDHGVKMQPVPTSLYTFDVVAPRWSPDAAGWSLVLTGLIGIVLVVRLLAGLWYKKRTR